MFGCPVLQAVVLLSCTLGIVHTNGDSGSPVLKSWQAHLEYIGVDTDLSWRTTDNKNATPCLGVCSCKGDYMDCSKKGWSNIPDKKEIDEKEAVLNKIRTLDLSDNELSDISDEELQIFPALQDLILKNNNLKRIPSLPLRGPNLKNLQLGGNGISSLSSDQLISFPRLTNLGLDKNELTSLEDHTFSANQPLAILNLGYNRISNISRDAFSNLVNLQILEINRNYLTEVPEALTHLTNLQRVTLTKNQIEKIPENILQNCSFLEQVELSGNPIHYYHVNAFVNLPKLKKLQVLSSPRYPHRFPNLTGTMNLELIHLDRANIRELPDNLCELAPKLRTLRLRSNSISELPSLDNCSNLNQLDLGSNNLSVLGYRPFHSLSNLQDLLLDHNDLTNLTADVFMGLSTLQILNLEKNNISEIHEETFMPLNNLRDLNLGENSFPTLPHQGLKTLLELKTHNNPNLKEFPGAQMFPNIRLVRPSYAYHCCQFLPSTYHNLVQEYSDFTDLSESVYFPEDFDLTSFGNQTLSWSAGNLSAMPGKDLNLDLWENFVTGMGYPDVSDYDETMISYFKPQEGIDCYPAPGPFLPCNDLFDWWSLRCGVWIVFLLALLGNGCVVFVLVLSRSKMDVPRFLVANLAAADFFMGLYLGFLAVLDASTLGEFRKYAIQWQLSAACEIAGFFGVLSSELSVFTLAVITLERNYAITHAMHLNKRLSLKHAAYIMIGAWSFSIIMASLPLLGISDYRKFAVCLPFETEGALSMGYVIFLMLINGVAFSILMGCYLKMYCAIRGSQAWNSNDSRIAKRMALLVFTDFLCWFPIAFFSITAACGANLISLEGAKVFTVFILPLNSCCNPFLYAILTKQFKKDCVMICKAIEESRVTRGIGRCRHSSNFSNRQTPANTNSLNSGSGSGSHSKNSMHCSCNTKKVNKMTTRWPLNKLKTLLCGIKNGDENSQNDWNYQIAEIQQKQQKTKRHASVSSDNFSSSRSDSWKQGHCVPLRFLDRPRRRNSWTVTRKPSQDSNLSSSRNDSAGSNSTQSTNTWRLSRSSVSSDISNSLGRVGSGYSDKSGTLGVGERGTKFGALARAQALYRQNGPPSSGLVKAGGGRGTHQSILLRGKPRLIRQVAIQDESPSTSSSKSVTFQDIGRPGEGTCPVHQDTSQYNRYRTLYAKLTENSQEEEEEEEGEQENHLVTTYPQHHHVSGISNPLSAIPDDDDDEAVLAATQSPPPPDEVELGDNNAALNQQQQPPLSSAASASTSMVVVGVEGGGGAVAGARSPTSLDLTTGKNRSLDNLKSLHSPTLGSGRPLSSAPAAPPHQQSRTRRISLSPGSPVSYNPAPYKHRTSHTYTSLTNLTEPKYGPQKCTSENALLALQAKYGYSFQSAVEGTGLDYLPPFLVAASTSGRPPPREDEDSEEAEDSCCSAAEEEEDEAECESRSVIGLERRTLLPPPSVAFSPAAAVGTARSPGSASRTPVQATSRTPTIEEVPEETEKLL